MVKFKNVLTNDIWTTLVGKTNEKIDNSILFSSKYARTAEEYDNDVICIKNNDDLKNVGEI